MKSEDNWSHTCTSTVSFCTKKHKQEKTKLDSYRARGITLWNLNWAEVLPLCTSSHWLSSLRQWTHFPTNLVQGVVHTSITIRCTFDRKPTNDHHPIKTDQSMNWFTVHISTYSGLPCKSQYSIELLLIQPSLWVFKSTQSLFTLEIWWAQQLLTVGYEYSLWNRFLLWAFLYSLQTLTLILNPNNIMSFMFLHKASSEG